MNNNKKLSYILLCSILISCSAHALEFKRTEETSAFPVKRTKVIPKTLVFAENQIPYTLYQNFLHRWSDRPLFSNAGFRSQANVRTNSSLRDIEIARNYGLNGLASLDHYHLYYQRLKDLEKAKIKGYSDLYVLNACRKYNDKKVLESVRKALNSPYTTKVNGKLLIWNYGGQGKDRAMKFAEVLNKYPELKNKFLIFGNVPFLDLYRAYYKKSATGGKVPQTIVDDFKRKTMKTLDVCDGIILWESEYYLDYKSDYPYKILSTPIFRNYILPIVMNIISMPKYKNKMLGAYSRHAYINKFSGSAFGEYGTKGFRTYMDEAMLYNPDVIVLFEWNEANECTYFQPSVANGRSLERILNYYLQLIRHEDFKPRSGDNLAIPNLIYTARRNIRTGETLHLEVLNVPDQNVSTEFTARLILKNGKGKVVAEFPAETFNRNKFLAVTYRLPSEQFASSEVLVPEIIITENGKKQVFNACNYTALHPTVCVDYKSTRHPLREMLIPEKCNFKVTRQTEGKYLAKVDFKVKEKLVSLEILCDGDELYAFDKSSEFDRDKYAIFTGSLTSLPISPSQTGTIRIDNTTDWKVRNAFLPYEALSIKKLENNCCKLKSTFRGSRSYFIFRVPLNDLNQAVFNINYEKAGNYTCKLADLYKIGNLSKNLANGIRLNLERADKLPDIVPPIQANSASFQTILRTKKTAPVFQLRAITESGKIFRSIPITFTPDKKILANKTIYSNYRRKPIKAQIPKQYIPDLKYKFDSRKGAILPCSTGKQWNISLGGGFDYGDPMWRNNSIITKDNVTPTPQWITDQGCSMLQFNGKNDYMVIPMGAIPRSSCFTIEFEIYPESNNDQVLLRSKIFGRNNGLDLVITEGKLRGIYHGIKHRAVVCDTGLDIISGKWNKICIKKNFTSIVFMVNGKRKAILHERRGVRPSQYTFGANITSGPGIPEKCTSFKGKLRSFRILHDIKDDSNSPGKFKCDFIQDKNGMLKNWRPNLSPVFKPLGKFKVIKDGERTGIEITPQGRLAAIFSSDRIPCKAGDTINITAKVSGRGTVQVGIYMYSSKGKWRGEISKWIKASETPQMTENNFVVKKPDVAVVAIVIGSNNRASISNLMYEKITHNE